MKQFQSALKKQNIKSLFVIAFIVLYSCVALSQTITRTQIHYNAIPFTTYTFTASSANIQNNTSCPSAGGGVTTPTWVTVGPNTVGMAYCWGGFSSESSFTSGLTAGKSAGDDDCTTNGDCCESCALGVDCSGFVSHAWGLTTKYSTNTLPSISNDYTSGSQVKQGDIFNLAGSHVRLVDTNYTTGTFLLMESSAVDWKVSYRSYTASQLTSYDPRWYVNVDTSSFVCSKIYATIPYSTSFENAWVMDTCNDGAQRAPDKYWKSNIGGTTPTGDDYWHRDDYTGVDWSTPTSGAYTPAASTGSYSARFHNDPPPAGSTGAMDLYVNLSPSGSKTISFDYIHDESSPSPFSFNVLLSTDGGNTFPTTLYTITTASFSTWTTQTIATTAASATSVLRFIIADKGTHDIGIDNFSVSLSTTTDILTLNENTELEIFPNPNDGTALNGRIPKAEGNTIDVSLFDMLGREVVNKKVGLEGNNFFLNMSDCNLKTGVYLFIATSGGKQFQKKIVIN
jgi:hypothetical protein